MEASGGTPGGSGGSAGSQSGFVWQHPNNPTIPPGIWGSSASDVYAIRSREVWRGTGTQFSSTVVGTQHNLIGLWGSSASRILALNASGEIYESAGDQQWSAAAAVTPVLDTVTFAGLWGSGDTLFAFGGVYGSSSSAGAAVFRQLADGSWESISDGLELAGYIRSLWGSSTTDLYACNLGHQNIYHYVGSAWQAEVAPSCLSISGSGASDVYMAGQSGVYHSSGDGNWSKLPVFWNSSEVPFVIFALPSGAVFMGTNKSGVYFFDGTTWSQIGDLTQGSHQLMWAPSADEVYISGLDGFWFGKRR